MASLAEGELAKAINDEREAEDVLELAGDSSIDMLALFLMALARRLFLTDD